MGNLTLANREAAEAVNLTNSEDPQAKYLQAVCATVFALAGDSAKATRMADDLERRFPENTVMNIHYLPMIRGAIAIKSGNPAKAIEHWRRRTARAVGGTNIILYRVYLRDWRIWLRGRRTGCRRFKKILDNRGLVRTGQSAPWRIWVLAAPSHRRDSRKPGRYGLSSSVERRRPRHPHPEASQRGVCKSKLEAGAFEGILANTDSCFASTCSIDSTTVAFFIYKNGSSVATRPSTGRIK
jgi:hypothetical protein